MPVDDFAIVLTGTIVPNAPFTTHSNSLVRRREYLEALQFYSQFAPVYFLENSTYKLGDDMEFYQITNVMIRQHRVSSAPERGKGYQEFEMIDNWLLNEPRPPQRWIKITGRYLYRNFAALLADYLSECKAEMIIDRCARSKLARSYLFCVGTTFYLKHIAGLYHQCNDQADEWIEHVLYRRLAVFSSSSVRLFSIEPRLSGISGTTGNNIEVSPARYLLKRLLRPLNYVFDKRELWYTR